VTRRTDRPTRPNLKNKSTDGGGGEGHEICSGVCSLDVVVGMGLVFLNLLLFFFSCALLNVFLR